MDLIIKDRGHGKTTELVKKSAETGCRILTLHSSKHIQDIANNLGMTIPTPLERCHLNLRQFQGFKEPVLIDELDTFIEHALGYKVVAATLPSEKTKVLEESEHVLENKPKIDIVPTGYEFTINQKGFYGKAVILSNNIKNVIFNNPATIVYWEDGSKTVVKCQDGDTYSEELGLAMCIVKKLYGNKGNYNDMFKKWLPKEGKTNE